MTPNGKDLRAGEYVLGTLEDAERRQVEVDLQSDPVLAGYVDEWSNRLAPMIDMVRPVAPSPAVWRRIERAVGPEPGKPTQGHKSLGRLWERVSFWRWTTAGTGFAAVAALVLLVVSVALQPTVIDGPPRVAALSETGQSPSWLITVDADARQIDVQPAESITIEAGRAFELWLLPASGDEPLSLGLLDVAGPSQLQLEGEVLAALAGTPALAISLEPGGGSPTGLPTGPVVYQGALLSP